MGACWPHTHQHTHTTDSRRRRGGSWLVPGGEEERGGESRHAASLILCLHFSVRSSFLPHCSPILLVFTWKLHTCKRRENRHAILVSSHFYANFESIGERFYLPFLMSSFYPKAAPSPFLSLPRLTTAFSCSAERVWRAGSHRVICSDSLSVPSLQLGWMMTC